ncbi:hypothetical protein BGW80DRAFT_1257484 [Lactifluus volemus]|nr:hypothetical protein BGW80DRAFT_1257484 [Lactifluus volemus]
MSPSPLPPLPLLLPLVLILRMFNLPADVIPDKEACMARTGGSAEAVYQGTIRTRTTSAQGLQPSSFCAIEAVRLTSVEVEVSAGVPASALGFTKVDTWSTLDFLVGLSIKGAALWHSHAVLSSERIQGNVTQGDI